MKRFVIISELRHYLNQEKIKGRTVAFVPTMGALHAGHKSCIDIAGEKGALLVVSVFINPTQFDPGEDYAKYPRRFENDFGLLNQWGCDAVFTPSADEMYAGGENVWVDVEGITEDLCGRTRQRHFRGVATVVAKLFNIVEPDVAVFGQKDAQQAVVIRNMVEQLKFPIKMELSPIVRENGGLAVSSRNEYLSDADRHRAQAVYAGLRHGYELIRDGLRDPAGAVQAARKVMEEASITHIEYIELVRASDLKPADTIAGVVMLAAAVRIRGTRLIDNIVMLVDDEVRETLLF